MPESFDELVRRAQQEQAQQAAQAEIAARQARIQEEERRARQAAFEAETVAVRALAIREAKSVAAQLIERGIQPNVAGISLEASAAAAQAQRIRPKKVPSPPSAGQLRRKQARGDAIRSNAAFYVWDLETEWQWGGDDEDSSPHIEHNFLSRMGSIYHCDRYYGIRSSNWTLEGFIPMRAIEGQFEDYNRFTSVRNGLAKLAARYSLQLPA